MISTERLKSYNEEDYVSSPCLVVKSAKDDWYILDYYKPKKHDLYIVTQYFPRISTYAWWFNKEQCFKDSNNQKINVVAWRYMPKPFYHTYE